MVSKKYGFFKPSKQYHLLSVLTEIERQPSTTQRALGQQALVSSTMVNNYISEMEIEGFVTANGSTNRNFNYHLTVAGVNRRNELFFQCSREIIQFYGSMKQEFKSRLEEHYKSGIRRVVLFGAAETGELLYITSKGTGIEVIGIVDNDTNKHGKKVLDMVIQPPSAIGALKPDAVIITSFGHMDEIFGQVKHLESEGVKVRRL